MPKIINRILAFIILPVSMLFCAFGLCQNDALISIDLKDTSLKDTMKIISQSSGMNIVLDKDVDASITITLKDVSWKTALETILKTNQLTYRIQDNIIRVMTASTAQKEQEVAILETRIITLNFAKAEELQRSLTKILSSKGSIEVNIPTNSLIANDTPEALDELEKLAQELDVLTPQVMIEAMIVSVKLSDTDKLGIDWTATDQEFTTATSTEGKRQWVQTLKPSSSALDIYYGKTVLPGWYFASQIALYAQDKKVKILANPRISTLDNLQANIEITEQVPYTYTAQSTEGSSSMSSTQFKDVGIKLYVTPHITKDNFISLSVKTEQSFVASYVGSSNEPSIDSRKVDTNLMLKDGETVVIGGLRKKEDTTTIDKIPLLGDIPFLGKLFQKTVKDITDTELVIFITPHIVNPAGLSVKEKTKLDEARDELEFMPNENKKKKAIRQEFAKQKHYETLSRTEQDILQENPAQPLPELNQDAQPIQDAIVSGKNAQVSNKP